MCSFYFVDFFSSSVVMGWVGLFHARGAAYSTEASTLTESTARLVYHQPSGPSPTMAAAPPRWRPLLLQLAIALGILLAAAEAWTGEIRGRVVCDVCGDAAIGPEDHALEGQSAPCTCFLSPRADLSTDLCSAPRGSPVRFRSIARADLGLGS
jgi:hypothetical protein